MRPDAVVSGVVVLSVDGEVDGKPGRADFATLSGGKRREIPFTFRYLENIEEEITLPPGMKPEQLLVEVQLQPARLSTGAAVLRLECRSAVGPRRDFEELHVRATQADIHPHRHAARQDGESQGRRASSPAACTSTARVHGNVRSTAEDGGALSVSESGFIEGNVEVTNIVMNGTVNGDMCARERAGAGRQGAGQGQCSLRGH